MPKCMFWGSKCFVQMHIANWYPTEPNHLTSISLNLYFICSLSPNKRPFTPSLLSGQTSSSRKTNCLGYQPLTWSGDPRLTAIFLSLFSSMGPSLGQKILQSSYNTHLLCYLHSPNLHKWMNGDCSFLMRSGRCDFLKYSIFQVILVHNRNMLPKPLSWENKTKQQQWNNQSALLEALVEFISIYCITGG